MGLIDKVTERLPWRHDRRHERREPAPSTAARGDLLPLREDLDRWMQRLLDEPLSGPSLSELGWMPAVDVHETDDEIMVTVEVPGLDPGDLDLMVTPGGLIIRGEKHEVREDKAKGVRVTPEGLIVRGDTDTSDPRADTDGRHRDVYVSECRYGSFVRTVPLPPGVDLDRAEAR